jgi:hypothetical protein
VPDEMQNRDSEFAQDLLRGAKEIAIFLYGDAKFRRRVYHLIATSRLPHFTLGGSVICARKSVLLDFVKQQEQRHANDNRIQEHAAKRNA